MNLPGTPSCTVNGACITDLNSLAGLVQIGTAGNKSRLISGGFTRLRDLGTFPTFHALADGYFGIFPIQDVHYNPPAKLMMIEFPPFTVDDAVDRTTFVRAPITITTPSGLGIATATVEFGYQELGGYCTSRAETCVAASATVTDATPFWFKTSESGSYTKASCATSCTITLPVLPGHIAHYQVKFYDSGGSFIQNGASGVAIEGTVR